MEVQSVKVFKNIVKHIILITAITIGVFLIGSFTPYSPIFLGLALGTFVSLINTLLIAWKTNKIGEIISNTNIHNKKRFVSSGMLTRMATSILAVMLVFEYPQHINLFSTLIGLVIVQIISVVVGIRAHD